MRAVARKTVYRCPLCLVKLADAKAVARHLQYGLCERRRRRRVKEHER